MSNIGIMQGRLIPPTENRFQSFPRFRWEDEFEFASLAGLDCIEWIHDLYGADVNPISTDAGIERMKSLSSLHGVKVLSLCADYFMDKPLLRCSLEELDERFSFLVWLMGRCQLVGINRIVLPFVDASRIDTEDDLECVIKILHRALAVADQTGVEVHLETSLDPERFSRLLAMVSHPMLKANYDSGNSASLGYRIEDEFEAYGYRIGSIHIKDRVLGGGTTPLNTGNVDFSIFAKCLKAVRYQGDFILQAARGAEGDEVALAKKNRSFVIQHVINPH